MLNAFDSLEVEDRIIVALDCAADEALEIALSLKGKARWMKVGMTLFYESGPSVIKALKEAGFKVFLDLKFYDIPHQVEGAAASATSHGVDMLTMHTSGGLAMMEAAQKGAIRAAHEAGFEVPATLGITVLTSMDDATLAQIGVNNSMADQVRLLAHNAQEAKISGVVASPQEASMLRELLGAEAYIVTPGVRPIGSEKGDQSRVATPAQALSDGASHIVIGRPITQAANRVAAFDEIVKEIKNEC
ncbi:MAG: orotidine-5'-phosphate decarboxylase [Raoultibacter sp.]|jgi:orotidine-5'-phosphate decarboxylase